MKDTQKGECVPFTEEERRNLIEFGNALRLIHEEMVREGYFMPRGRLWDIFKCTDENGKPRSNLV
ncbi:MAG: hypothetical protein WA060_02600 [Minisyncoccia bacterium]